MQKNSGNSENRKMNLCGQLPLVDTKNIVKVKKKIREEMLEHGIVHTTIEIENDLECEDCECEIIGDTKIQHHHHHH